MIIVCAHSEKFITLHRQIKTKDNNLKKGKKIMFATVLMVAVLAATVAQAVRLGHKIDLQK